MENNDTVDKVVNIVLSSTRAMPAIYTSNGNKNQSFCVDFEIDNKEECILASFVWEYGGEAYMNSRNELWAAGLELRSIMKVGEDILIGAYILEKLGDSVNIEELVKKLIKSNITSGIFSETALASQTIQNFFQICRDFGLNKARGKNMANIKFANLGNCLAFTDNPNLKYDKAICPVCTNIYMVTEKQDVRFCHSHESGNPC